MIVATLSVLSVIIFWGLTSSKNFNLRQSSFILFTSRTKDNLSDKKPHFIDVHELQNLSCCQPKSYPNPRPFLSWLQPSLNPSCEELFSGNETEQSRVRNAQQNLSLPSDAEIFAKYSRNNCNFVQDDFNNNFYISQDEIDFPIAYEMLIYYQKNRFLQALNLLKFIYRPQNMYCLHIDKNSPNWWINGVKNFMNCLPNVFVAKKLIRIHYGTVSILDAHLSCLSELLTVPHKWKYVLTLHSPEIALITNRDIVKNLKGLKGGNIVTRGSNASNPKTGNPYKWLMHKRVSPDSPPGEVGPLPNFTVYKSAESINSALTRDFVNYMFTNSKAIALRKRLEYTQSAEEYYFVTLDSLGDAPGNRWKLRTAHVNMPQFSRRLWAIRKRNGCAEGYIRHTICIVSTRDLPSVKYHMEHGLWFYNKYFIDYDYVVNDCIQSLLLQKNFDRYKLEC